VWLFCCISQVGYLALWEDALELYYDIFILWYHVHMSGIKDTVLFTDNMIDVCDVP
jgi:hypothetical protein